MTMTKGVGAKIKMLTQTDRFCVRGYFLSRVETKVIAFIIHSFLIYLLFFQVHTHTHIENWLEGNEEENKAANVRCSLLLFNSKQANNNNDDE